MNISVQYYISKCNISAQLIMKINNLEFFFHNELCITKSRATSTHLTYKIDSFFKISI